MAPVKNRKVAKYRKPININVGIFIFGFMFIYMIICIYMYLTTKHVSPYEVKAGEITVDNVYTGLILRSETVVNADKAGYVNYYAREGQKAGVKSKVYAIDESGKLAETIASSVANGQALLAEDITSLQAQMTNFTSTYQDINFSEVYDFKYNIEGKVMELMTENMMEDFDAASQGGDTGMFNMYQAAEPGIIEYNIDNMEAITPDSLSADLFKEENYKKTNLRNNSIVNPGDPVYKLITDENWSVVVPVEEKRLKELTDVNSVEIRFLKDNLTAWASLSILQIDGANYLKLDFKNSMVRYASDRFISIELLLDNKTGLKIPVSSIVKKDFYTMPVEYVTKGGDDDTSGFLREVLVEGQVSSEFVPVTLYYKTETDYFVDMSDFKEGENIIKPDSADQFQIGPKASLQGVYNINKGYAVFKQISSIYENEEYCIVKEGTTYGLSIYDHIVLDGSTVKEDEIIY